MIDLITIVIRLFISVLLGSLIGLERERKKGSAGLRTHLLVCMGSTLIMLTSIYMAEIYKNMGGIDPGRIAAGVVTGIGFLGAGTIIRSSEGVRGLTTAASIWVSAAIGLAVGCGFISGALIVTLISYLSLSFLKKIEKDIF
ncbi:MAG: MgtC/SapB family protein [Candidatus Omnitrophica bacterium]|nr:MgtC/SapB family protein [Candidatus Omnitrophota bacterium]